MTTTDPQTFDSDDYTFNRILPHADTWMKGRDLSILTFTACSRVTAANGGTWFIPGSHLWSEEEAKPSFDDALQLELEVGDTFMYGVSSTERAWLLLTCSSSRTSFLCSAFHAGGPNNLPEGSLDSVRTMVALGFCQGTLRQEENQFLSLDHAKLAKLPRQVAELAGWSIAQPK